MEPGRSAAGASGAMSAHGRGAQKRTPMRRGRSRPDRLFLDSRCTHAHSPAHRGHEHATDRASTLIVPSGCGFRVGSETREWIPGKAWVFDDTIEHEAWNQSDTPRAILIFDIWNPYLTETERDLVRAATEVVGTYYGVRADGLA